MQPRCARVRSLADRGWTLNDFNERRRARAERYRELAEKARAKSDSAFNGQRQILGHIPFGQPILVGHHSEHRHRRDLERADRLMRKAVEESKLAEVYEQRAQTIEASTVIFSDDPQAPDKLRAKIEHAERMQEAMKAGNRIVRNSKLNDDEKVRQLVALGLSQSSAYAALRPDFAGRVGFPDYALANNRANIRRMQARLSELAKPANEVDPIEGQGWRIKEHPDDNRIRIFFDAIPDQATRFYLKSHGWKWSPKAGSWQRHLNQNGRAAARQFVASTSKVL